MRSIGRGAASLFCLAALLAPRASSSSSSSSPGTGGWRLVWADEFNGANGSGVDAAKWTVETGANGSSNHEAETYTARRENLREEDGNLVIEARRENLTGADGLAKQYTSARLNTRGKFEQTYGRFEARMKLPLGKGLWPAFWLLGGDVSTAGWPRCGEIDAMENIGEATRVYGTLHGPGYSGAHGIQARTDLPSGQSVDGQFHTYAVEWEPQAIRFYVDGTLYGTETPAALPAGAKWVYDHPFFVILNLAVGGDWPGYPDGSTRFPQRMLVDYVRVYARGGGAAAPAGGI